MTYRLDCKICKITIVISAALNIFLIGFIGLAEKVSGQNLQPFFRAWLYTAAKPVGLTASSHIPQGNELKPHELAGRP